MSSLRIIKKYPNRRLYDTELSRYITLANVRELVMQGTNVKVVDANTNEGLTRSILLQIIIEQESSGKPLFTNEILSKLIRFYGNSVQGAFSSYLEESLDLFIGQQAHVQKQLQEIMGGTPVDSMADLAKRNLEIWRKIQQKLIKRAGFTSGSQKNDTKLEQDED